MIKSIKIYNQLITYTKIPLNNKWNFYIANLQSNDSIYWTLNTFKTKLQTSNITPKLLNDNSANTWLKNSLLIFKLFFSTIYGNYIGGSRALRINSEKSDYDIIFILNDTQNNFITNLASHNFPIFYLEDNYSEVHAHFYFHTYNKILKYLSYFNYWIIENYLNKDYNLANSLILNKTKMSIFFNKTSKDYFKESLTKIDNINHALLLEAKNNDLIWISKRLEKSIVHLAIINCQLQNKQIDKDKIIKLKEYARLNCNRLLVDPPIKFEPEVMQYLKDNLIELNDYFENRFNE